MENRFAIVATLLAILGFAGFWRETSAEGCFWISRCQNLWLGGCENGYVPVETSNDCQGLCAMPEYPTCHPLSTRFQCCSEGKARESTRCSKCPNKTDLGNDWVCCSDCSEPVVTDAKRKTGYCQTDSYLSFQPKPRELFKWHAGTWKSCLGNCKKASKSREVKCLRFLEDTPQFPSVVSDNRCLASSKPPSKERCTPQRCFTDNHKRQGLSAWVIVLISLIGIAATGGLALLGFIIYKRRGDSSNHGFVYVMLDNY